MKGTHLCDCIDGYYHGFRRCEGTELLHTATISLYAKPKLECIYLFFIPRILVNRRQYSWVSLTLIFHRNKHFDVISMVDKCTDHIRLLLICFLSTVFDARFRFFESRKREKETSCSRPISA